MTPSLYGNCCAEVAAQDFFVLFHNPNVDEGLICFLSNGEFIIPTEVTQKVPYDLTIVFFGTEIYTQSVSEALDVTDILEPYVKALNDPQVKTQIVDQPKPQHK